MSALETQRETAVRSDHKSGVRGSDLTVLCEAVRALFRAEGACILNLTSGMPVVVAAAGTLTALIGRAELVDLLMTAAVRDRRTLLSNDAAADQRIDHRLRDRFDIRQAAVAPFGAGGEWHGVILCINPESGAFSSDDAAMLENVAQLGSRAIRNETLYRREQRSGREARALVELVHHLNLSLDLEHVASLVAHHAAHLLDARGAVLSIRDGDELIALAVAGEAATELGRRVPLHVTISGEAVVTSRPLRSSDVRRDQRWPLTIATVSDSAPNAIAVPLRIGNDAIGAVMVYGNAVRDFTAHDQDVLEALASHAAVAVNNARLFEAQRRERAIAEAGAALARTVLNVRSLETTAHEILAIFDGVVTARGLALAVVSEPDSALRYAAATGVLSRLRGAAVPGHEAEEPPPERLSFETLDESERMAICPDEPFSCVALAIVAGHRLIGRLLLAFQAEPAPASLETLERLAEPTALALEFAAQSERERSRQEREHLLASALATMDQPIFILDLDRRIRYANVAAVREYGYSADELATLSVDALVASAVPARRVNSPNESVPGSTWIAEHVHRRKDASRFPASVVLSYIRMAGGEPHGQVLSVRNLTEERRVEEQLRQSEKLVAIGELVAGVAHELNNPLAGISAFAQLLLDEPLTTDQQESVRLVKREADRATDVIRDLLTFARKAGPELLPVDVNEVVRLATRLRAYNLRSAGVTLELDLDPAVPLARGDGQRLQQVVLNLIVNAEYAMRESAARRLTIRTAADTGSVLLVVADSGTGMSEETRSRIFEPFFTTKPPGEGTGLGMSVSYGIVHAHGGTISVDTEPGQGTTFTILLPSVDASRSASAPSQR